MKTFKTLTLVVAIFFTGTLFSQTTSIDVLTEKYDAILKEQNKGIGLLIKKDNQIETAALGAYDLTAQKVFNIGSATKTFTAILILQELEKGNLKLSDSIGTFLTPINNVDGSLTIESLLTHESGLDEVVEGNIVDIFFSKDDSVYNQNLLEQIEPNKPEEIGKFNYCNTNYLLLGKILEKINDQQYFDLLEQRIFKPLQLTNTYPYLHKNINNLAPPTFQDKDVSEYINHHFYGEIPNAAGSIASTLEDMEVFYTSLFETEKLLKKESLQRMLTSGNEFYGLGIFKLKFDVTQEFYGHGGNNIGYAFTNAYNIETKELYLIFSNSISIPINSIESDVLDYLNDKPLANLEAIDIDSFKTLEGAYLIKEANLTLKIKVEGTKMFLVSEAQGMKSELNQKNDTTLVEPTTGVTLTKIKDDTSSLTFSQNGFTTTINRVTSND